jgi:cysteinyl-tRNA synthetase
MSKSLGNTKTVDYVLQKWGPNIIRLFCLSGHYSKPVDYSEDMLKETVTKWRQVENAYAEITNPENDNMVLQQDPNLENLIKQKIENHLNKFNNSLNSDFNTSLALNSFYVIVDEINNLASSEHIAKSIAEYLLSIFKKMLNILGLKIDELSKEENESIKKLVDERKSLRDAKDYQGADKIRNQLSSQGIILIDHKKRTIWLKQEKIEA